MTLNLFWAIGGTELLLTEMERAEGEAVWGRTLGLGSQHTPLGFSRCFLRLKRSLSSSLFTEGYSNEWLKFYQRVFLSLRWIHIFFFYLLMLWNTQADFLMLNLYSGTALEEGTQVQSLVQEDPMYFRGTKPMPCNYWAQALEPSSRNYWSPCTLEPMFHNKRSHCNEKPVHCN